MTDERLDQLDALAAAARFEVDGSTLLDIERLTAERDAAARERDELRAALEPFASAFDRDRMPVTARRDYQRASAALHSKDGAS